MSAVLAHDVYVDIENTVTILKAGTVVPEEFAEYVTNPKAYVESADTVADEASGEPAEERPYSKWTNVQLQAELKRRELPVHGNKPELVDRLEFDDLEREELGESSPDGLGDDLDGDEPDEIDDLNEE
jgi:SAP domain